MSAQKTEVFVRLTSELNDRMLEVAERMGATSKAAVARRLISRGIALELDRNVNAAELDAAYATALLIATRELFKALGRHLPLIAQEARDATIAELGG